MVRAPGVRGPLLLLQLVLICSAQVRLTFFFFCFPRSLCFIFPARRDGGAGECSPRCAGSHPFHLDQLWRAAVIVSSCTSGLGFWASVTERSFIWSLLFLFFLAKCCVMPMNSAIRNQLSKLVHLFHVFILFRVAFR